jgi:regulator of Ty1 transposition protein 109
VQQVLVTMSADVDPAEELSGRPGLGDGKDEGRTETITESPEGTANGATAKDSERLLLCALEAYVYHVPSTSSCLVYISKVDSTGYSPSATSTTVQPTDSSSPDAKPSTRLPPTTYFLLKAFLSFYLPLPLSASPRVVRPHNHKHAYVNLFARSANQYLFPNSILGGGKKVLGGVKLCKWWRRVFEDIIVDLQKERDAAEYQSYLTYFLPSYEALDARSLLGIPAANAPSAASTSPRTEWRYLPPGDPSLNSLLFPPETGNDGPIDAEGEEKKRKSRSLVGMLVPTFEDDPKARFLVELVINNPVGKMRAGKGKRQGEQDDAAEGGRKRQRVGESVPTQDDSAAANTTGDTINTDGASSSSAVKDIKDKRRNEERRLRQEDAAALATISWDNFWTRMGYRQECISNDVTGFFSMYVGLPSSTTTENPPATASQEEEEQPTSEGQHQVSHPLFSRIAAALLNHDFANRQLAIDATGRFLRQTENIVVPEIGQDLWNSRCTARRDGRTAGSQRFAGEKEEEASEIVTSSYQMSIYHFCARFPTILLHMHLSDD